MDKTEVKDRLETAYARNGKTVQVERLQRLTGGSAAQTWSFVMDGGVKNILRTAHEGEQFALGLDKQAEAQVQNLAAQHGVKAAPISLVLGEEDGLGEGFVMPFFEGESIPQRILRKDDFVKARSALTKQCGRELALVHGVDFKAATLLPSLSAAKQLELMDRYYQDIGQVIPVFDYAFHWLFQNQPKQDVTTVVHGDFRNGNLLVDADGLSCVMDWELSHLGDPMEDLGWLCVPSWRFGNLDKPVGGFGSREELFAAYEAAGGATIDPKRVRYWEIFGVLKWGVVCLYQTDIHKRGIERSVNRAAIGRRVSETELDLLAYLREGI